MLAGSVLSTYSTPDEEVPKEVTQGLRKATGDKDNASDRKRHFPPESDDVCVWRGQGMTRRQSVGGRDSRQPNTRGASGLSQRPPVAQSCCEERAEEAADDKGRHDKALSKIVIPTDIQRGC